MDARMVRDADGDVWEERSGGYWVDLAHGCWIDTYEGLARVFGPLTEVAQP